MVRSGVVRHGMAGIYSDDSQRHHRNLFAARLRHRGRICVEAPMTASGLTKLQQHVMVAAWIEHAIGRNPHIPNGVYRSLRMMGLLRECGGHYELTAEGDHLIRGIAERACR